MNTKFIPKSEQFSFFSHEIFLHWCMNVTYNCALIKKHNSHENQCNIWNKVFGHFNAAHANYDNWKIVFLVGFYNTKRLIVKYAKLLTLVITLKVDLLVFPHGCASIHTHILSHTLCCSCKKRNIQEQVTNTALTLFCFYLHISYLSDIISQLWSAWQNSM